MTHAFRIPPQASEVEKHVVGAMMIDADALAIASATLTADDFYLERHQVIFETCCTMVGQRTAPDLLTVLQELRRTKRVDQAGGEDYLLEISSEVVSSANVEQHCTILREQALYRRQIRVATGILERAYEGTLPAQDAQEQAEAEILAIGETRGRGAEMLTQRQAIARAAENWKATLEGKQIGMLSNIPPVDELLSGFRPGKLYILAARPGLGKSMLALQIAMQCGKPVAHFSLEMLAEDQVERQVSQVSELGPESLQSRSILLAKAEVLKKAIEEIQDLPIWIAEESAVTPAMILSNCRRIKKKHGLGLVIVDYLQLITSPGKHQTRDLEVSAVSKFLKSLSMKLTVPVLAIASLSRKPEDRTDKRPLLSDLRESGSIESDADAVIFLYRESDYNQQAKKDFPDVTEMILAKMRGGKKGRSIANFDGAHSKFYKLHAADATRYLNFIGQKTKSEAPEAKPRTGYRSFLDD